MGHGVHVVGPNGTAGGRVKASAITGVLAFVATLGFASAVTAQQSDSETGAPAASRGSVWWSLGGGSGSVRLDCDSCSGDRDRGVALHLGVGATAHERLDVGLEVGRWSTTEAGVSQTTNRADVRTVFRPLSGLGFNLIAGAGWSGYTAGDLDFSSVSLSAGAGWDVPVANRWRVGARVLTDLWSYGSIVSTRLGDVTSAVSISVARLELVVGRR